jgi:hypothetical protein
MLLSTRQLLSLNTSHHWHAQMYGRGTVKQELLLSGADYANRNVGVRIPNIYHTPASITNASIATEIAKFSTAGTAAVINQIGDRQQMVWFMPFALDWAAPCSILQHSWITWVTRGLFVGFRRIYLGTQIDDVFLTTEMYRPQGKEYRTVPDDFSMHVAWQEELNARMPAGSEFFLELGHNGNGDIEASAYTAEGESVCRPPNAIDYPEQPSGSPDYRKPPGTGVNIWPATPERYTWSLECAEIDELQNWFAVEEQRDAFAHISHTLLVQLFYLRLPS